MKLINLFTQHLNDAGETYIQHLVRALSIVLVLTTAQVALVVHAFFPFLFVHTTSNKLKSIIEGIPKHD